MGSFCFFFGRGTLVVCDGSVDADGLTRRFWRSWCSWFARVVLPELGCPQRMISYMFGEVFMLDDAFSLYRQK